MKRKFILAFLLATAQAVSVSAHGFYNIVYNLEQRKIEVDGIAPKAYSNVTFELLHIGQNSELLKNILPQNAGNVVYQYDQCEADEKGNFLFSVRLPEDADSGEYAARISWGEGANEKNVIYISPEDYGNSMNLVNNAATEQQMVEALENGMIYLGITNPYFKKLNETEKKAIAAELIKNRKDGYADAKGISEVFINASAIQSINHIKKGEFDAEEIFNYYEDVLKISELAAYKTFQKQTDETKKVIYQKTSLGGDFETIEEVRSEFALQTVINSLYYAAGYDSVYDILKNNNNILNIDFSAYNNLSEKSSVDKKMIGRLFTSAKDVSDSFNAFVVSANSTSESSGGGGGRNSSSAGKSASLLPSANNEAIKTDDKRVVPEFNDIDNVEWAKKSIINLAECGIVSGKEEGHFDPFSSVKREEFVTMLVLALNIYDKNAVCNFLDADSSQWYYPYLASGVKMGLVNGISSSEFGVGSNIKKQDMAVLLYEAAKMKGKGSASAEDIAEFGDEDEISAYAKNAVNLLFENKIVSGNELGNFEPKKGATRAETAVMLDKFLKWVE